MICEVVALSLAIGVHLALVGSLGVSGGSSGKVVAVQTNATRPISVSLVKLAQNEKPAGRVSPAPSQPERIEPPRSVDQVSGEPQRAVPVSLEVQPFLTISRASEIYYFQSRELTEKPLVIEDYASNLLLNLPGVPSQIAEMRLFINELGEVDRIMIERSALPEQADHMIREALSKTKFRPGKIDRTPVKTQIKIEIAIETADAQARYADNANSLSIKSQAIEMDYVSK